MFEYDEEIEADHSGNFWRESAPSASLQREQRRLVFVAAEGFGLHELQSGETEIVFRVGNRMASGPPFGPRRWISEQGTELCCAHGLALPVASSSLVVLSTVNYEGSGNAVLAPDGSVACIVEGGPGATAPVWSNLGDLAMPSGGEYSDDGVFVGYSGSECSSTNITPHPQQQYLGFEMAAWSRDSQWLAASLSDNVSPNEKLTLMLIRRDGSDQQVLVPDGFSLWPIFSHDGGYIYFIRRSEWYSAGPDVTESIWRYEMATGELQPVIEMPGGWFARPQGWTEEGYLVLSSYRSRDEKCGYASCGNRVILFDVQSKQVVYASAPRDSTAYLGFLS